MNIAAFVEYVGDRRLPQGLRPIRRTVREERSDVARQIGPMGDFVLLRRLDHRSDGRHRLC